MRSNFRSLLLMLSISHRLLAQTPAEGAADEAPTPEAEPAPVPEPAAAPAAEPSVEPAPPPVVSQPPAPPLARPAPALAPGRQPEPWKRFQVVSDDSAHRLELHALVHADARFFLAGDARNTFTLRRVRPSLDGVVFRYYEFKVQSDLAGSKLQLLDAYANFHFIDALQLRAGKGKVPLGLERLQSPADITFAERAFPTLLVPNRDIGVQLHGVAFKGALEWAAGVYNGVPNGQSGDGDENDAKDVVGRAFVLPFAATGVEALEGLGAGVAASYGKESGALAPYKTSGQETFFAYEDIAVASGERSVVVPQGYYYFGPLGLMFEYAWVRERAENDVGASNKLTHRAWQAAGSIVIGGKPTYKGVKVKAPLDPERGTFGALELAGRYSEIHLDPDAFGLGLADPARSARSARAWAVGLTWHFAAKLRGLANYERTTFDGGTSGGDREPESLLISRVQVAF